jgi:AraC-like DNA-binding protein
VSGRILAATPERPFLCLKIDFDPLLLNEIAASLGKTPSKETEPHQRALFIGKAGDPMLAAAIRLVKLFEVPEDAAVLAPLVIKEIFYYLLKGADGPPLLHFLRSGSIMCKISKAIYSLIAGLEEDADVTALARAANMSRSAFFRHFKEATAMSPIQYQKRLRLLEARRLMTEGETAESSAFKVGYNSASQFSREYSRMFGSPPFRDAIKIKKTGSPLQQI